MPRKMSSDNSDIILPENLHKASLVQLTKLPKEVLTLHLLSQHINARGTTQKLARLLFNSLNAKPVGLFKRQIRRPNISLATSTPSSVTARGGRIRKTRSTERVVLSKEKAKFSSSNRKRSNSENTFRFPTPKQMPSLRMSIHEVPLKQDVLLKDVESSSTKNHATSETPFCLPTPKQTQKMVMTSATSTLQLSPPLNFQSTASNSSFNVSVPLLLIPNSVQESIIKGEYIDFAQLLSRVIIANSNNSSSLGKMYQPPNITSFTEWMEAWNKYLTVIITHSPSRALEMIGYQRIITSANSQVPLSTWLAYDVQFRMLAAFNHDLRWDTRHQDLWLQCLVIDQYDQEYVDDDILIF